MLLTRATPTSDGVIRFPVRAPDRRILVGIIAPDDTKVAMLLGNAPTMFAAEILRDGSSHGVGLLGAFSAMQHLPMRPSDTILAGTATLPACEGVLVIHGATAAIIGVPDLVH